MNTNKGPELVRKRFLTIKQFCLETNISRTTLYRHLKKGAIPFIRIGSRVLIAAAILDKLAAEAGESGGAR